MHEMPSDEGTNTDAPLPTGAFIPFNSHPKRGRNSRNVGWIVAENGCHVWCGGKTKKGYGYVRYNGRNRPAHIIRYEMEVGPVPQGMILDHFVCDNPPCCNPTHVRPATVRENTLRGNGVTAINAAKTHCPLGHSLSGDNLCVSAGAVRPGTRSCRTCRRNRERRRIGVRKR